MNFSSQLDVIVVFNRSRGAFAVSRVHTFRVKNLGKSIRSNPWSLHAPLNVACARGEQTRSVEPNTSEFNADVFLETTRNRFQSIDSGWTIGLAIVTIIVPEI